MNQPLLRDQETRELIERFQAERKRRRRLRLLLGSLGGVVLIAAIAAGVVLVAGSRGNESATGNAAVASISGDVPSHSSPSSPSSSSTSSSPDQNAWSRPVSPTSHTITTLPPVSGSTTTSPVASSTSAPVSLSAVVRKTVVIDPGHQAEGDFETEPVGPGSNDYKAKVSSGTAGSATGIPESELVLAISLKLRDALTAHGVEVVMTRTTQDVDLSNIERAQIANDAGADLFVRIHADGSDDPAASGIHVLYPASIKGWTDDIATASREAAELAQRELIAATGAVDRGIDARSDMTGFNWADVPVILPEIGFMTNAAEDRLLATPAYQDKIVLGLTRAIVSFLGLG